MSCTIIAENEAMTQLELENKMLLEATAAIHDDKSQQNTNKESMSETWRSGRTESVVLADSSGESELSILIDHVENKAGSIRRFRNLCGKIVNDVRVQNFVVLLILVNAIMMGVATFHFVTDNPKVSAGFDVTDQVFLIIFTVELSFQLVYHGFALFKDGWLVFDFAIIVMSWSLSSLRIIRTFRIFRALRLVTRVKVLKNLVTALFSVGPRMCGIGALLMLIFYIYGVMCTVLFKDLYANGVTDTDYFSRLDLSFWTLFVMMTLDWTNVSRQVMSKYSWSWMVFVSFVMITSFMVYNLVIAVVCDSVAIIEAMGKEEDLENVQSQEQQNLEHVRNLTKRVNTLASEQELVLNTLFAALEKAGVDYQSTSVSQELSSVAPSELDYINESNISSIMTPQKAADLVEEK